MNIAGSLNKGKVSSFSFALLGLILTAFTGAFAQSQPGSPDRGAKVGNAYAISDLETINTTNGNLMLNFPLGSLPGGRGDVSGGINLMYSSKLYDTRTQMIEDTRVPCSDGHCTYFQRMVLEQSDKGGWRYSSVYRMEVEDRRSRYNGGNTPVCWIPGYGGTAAWNEMSYVYKVNIIFPDGSSHEMIPYGHDHAADGQRYYNIAPDGIVESCGQSPTQTNRPVYYSVDGTFLRLETSASGWTLHFSDGKKVVENTENPQKVYDRNGNYIEYRTIDNYNNTGHLARQVADQFGRTVTVEFNGIDRGEDAIHVNGFEGQDLLWKVKWKSIAPLKTYQACDSPCPQSYQRATLDTPMPVVDRITLPQEMGGHSYTFSYNAPDYSLPLSSSDGWGEVSGVTLPTEAEISYEYDMDGKEGPTESWLNPEILKNHPTTKILTYDLQYDNNSTSTSETWHYSTSSVVGTVTSPDGGVTTNYFGDTNQGGWDSGLALKSISADGTKTEKLWAQNYPAVCTQQNPCSGAAINPYVKTEFTSIKDASGNYSLTAIKDYSYDKNGNVTLVKEYDWVAYSLTHDGNGNLTGIPSNISPKRISATGYYAETPGASANSNDGNMYIFSSSPVLKNTLKWSEVRNGSNQAVSRSEISYDNPATTGNPTQTTVWDSAKGGYSVPLTAANSISTSIEYNEVKLPVKTIDAMGVESTLTYGCVNGEIYCEENFKNLYATKVEKASNHSALKLTSTSVFDFYTGLSVSTTDVDNNVTNATEYDKLGRPVKAIMGAGTALESWTQTEYDDINRRIIIRSDLEAKGDAKRVAVQFFDQIGRVRLSKTLEDSATQSAINENDGVKIQTRYKATFSGGAGYSMQLTSNPYRAAHSYDATAEPTMGWTLSKSLNTGKHSEVETFSGAGLPAPWGSNTFSTGVFKTDIDGNRTLITDQAGKRRISKKNALGQLTDIWEVKEVDNDTESISFGGLSLNGLKTSYQYDTLSNLTTVNQGAQARSFSYSSVSRLLTAQNPESGMISFQYDAGGRLTQKSQARSGSVTVTTDYEYDALNRIVQRSYSGESGYTTPTVSYLYDTLPHAKGKLTKVLSAVSATEYTGFDQIGRVTSYKQTTDGNDYTTSYTYNLSGALVEETYPTGRKVKNIIDGSGALSIVQSKKNSSQGYWDYANSFSYTAAGMVSSMQLGNNHWESTSFNSRLQPTKIDLGTTPGAADLLDLAYDYGTNQNNGNVQSQIITVHNVGAALGFVATQTYTYDMLNRLGQATETVPNQTGWQQAFTYDRYGNRRFDADGNHTTTLEANCPEAVCNPEIDPQNNRLAGYTFDSAGNTTKNAENQKFTYDGENKQIKVETVDSNGNVINTLGQYYYDGDGKRIKKESATETTIFIYDAAGKLITESSTQLSTDPQVAYLTSDNLGTPRINTNAGGAVIARHDYHPFGGEIASSQRSAEIGYDSDEIRKQFTNYEKDEETALNFAQNRYQSSDFGRFMTPDPVLSSAKTSNPATWNRYAYVLNNPLTFIDPLGLWKIMYRTVEWDSKEFGKAKVKKTEIYFVKTNKNDNAESLLKGLGISEKIKKDGKEIDNAQYGAMKAAITSSLKNDGQEVSSSGIGNDKLSSMYNTMAGLLGSQANSDAFNKNTRSGGPLNPDFNDCSMTTFKLFQLFNPSPDLANISNTEDADDALERGEASSVDPGDLRSGDFARMEDEDGKKHFMTLAFTNSDGTRMFFSRSGEGGPFQLREEKAFSAYGAVTGISDKHSGYYGRR